MQARVAPVWSHALTVTAPVNGLAAASHQTFASRVNNKSNNSNNNNNNNNNKAVTTCWAHELTVFMGDNSRQAAEVVALALHHTAHPDVIIQVETQWAMIPDWPASMPGSLKLPQNLQWAHSTL